MRRTNHDTSIKHLLLASIAAVYTGFELAIMFGSILRQDHRATILTGILLAILVTASLAASPKTTQ